MAGLLSWSLLVVLLGVVAVEGMQGEKVRATSRKARVVAQEPPKHVVAAHGPPSGTPSRLVVDGPPTQAMPAAQLPQPNILFILVDDLGWAEVEWNLPPQEGDAGEVRTPNLKQFATEGLILDRHYMHKFCGPSRTSIQSGRAPIHVNVNNLGQDRHNPDDPVSGYGGMPRNMTGIAEVMRGAGYSTHMVGKWDVGMATADHTPAGRGYDTSLIFFNHANDVWTHSAPCVGQSDTRDLWNLYGDIPFPGEPAWGFRNADDCSFKNQHPEGTCVMEDELFEQRVRLIVDSHDDPRPLFIFWSTRTVHAPLQPPDEDFAKFAFIPHLGRRQYRSMVSWLDGAVGRVVDTLKEKGLYENTLIVFTSDNGAQLNGGSNYPLKGGKASNWEGGIRVPTIVFGGLLPQAVRGTKTEALVAGWDWYATFAGLAGADPVDERAARAGLPPVDSIDQWPLLSGRVAAGPRTRLEIGTAVGPKGIYGTAMGGLIAQRPGVDGGPGALYKVMVAYGVMKQQYAVWTGPQSPNATGAGNEHDVCGRSPETGCLYDVLADPGEHHNLAAERPEIFSELLNEAILLNLTVFSPERGVSDPAACQYGVDHYRGYWGPFLP